MSQYVPSSTSAARKAMTYIQHNYQVSENMLEYLQLSALMQPENSYLMKLSISKQQENILGEFCDLCYSSQWLLQYWD